MKRNEIDEALQLEEREIFVHHHRGAIAALLHRGKMKLANRRARIAAAGKRDSDERHEKRRLQTPALRLVRA